MMLDLVGGHNCEFSLADIIADFDDRLFAFSGIFEIFLPGEGANATA
jgi:hypothetical protein